MKAELLSIDVQMKYITYLTATHTVATIEMSCMVGLGQPGYSNENQSCRTSSARISNEYAK
jgi:hypothetical protein